jgi:DNA-binding NarL/FixJ family response regulator
MTMSPPDIRVAIVEDQQHTRDGLAALIAGTPGYRMTGAFGSMEAALPRIDASVPDVALLDVGLPGMSGIEGARRLKAQHPELQILMLTVYADNEHIFEAICGGADGYLLKDTPPAQLLQAIRDVRQGGAVMSPQIARKVVRMFQDIAPPRGGSESLTARELEVLGLLAQGHSYKSAAAALGLSFDTIRFHIRNVYEKLHVHSKSEAVLKAFQSGLLR